MTDRPSVATNDSSVMANESFAVMVLQRNSKNNAKKLSMACNDRSNWLATQEINAKAYVIKQYTLFSHSLALYVFLAYFYVYSTLRMQCLGIESRYANESGDLAPLNATIRNK